MSLKSLQYYNTITKEGKLYVEVQPHHDMFKTTELVYANEDCRSTKRVENEKYVKQVCQILTDHCMVVKKGSATYEENNIDKIEAIQDGTTMEIKVISNDFRGQTRVFLDRFTSVNDLAQKYHIYTNYKPKSGGKKRRKTHRSKKVVRKTRRNKRK